MPNKKNPSRWLFVYGTLKRRGRLHKHLISHGAQYQGPARIRGRLFKINGASYPGAIPTRSQEFIRGELYQLEAPITALKRIDKLEGCDEGLYFRKLVKTWTSDNGTHRAWAYFYAKPLRSSRPIPSGHFPVGKRLNSARGAA